MCALFFVLDVKQTDSLLEGDEAEDPSYNSEELGACGGACDVGLVAGAGRRAGAGGTNR